MGEHTNKKVLFWAFFLTMLFAILEVSYGFITQSLALLSEGVHMASDGISLGIAALAVVLATKKANDKKMFGYRRAEPIAAFLNGLGLMIIPGIVMIEAVKRIVMGGKEILSQEMLVVASIGLVVNVIVAFLLSRGEKENINVRAAMLHIIADLISSVSTIAVSLLIMFFGWVWIDPIMSFIIALIIFSGGWKITKESLNILMEGAPDDIEVADLKKRILGVPGVAAISAIQIWCIAEDEKHAVLHLAVYPQSNLTKLKADLQPILEKNSLLTTIQFDEAEEENV